MRLVSGLEGTIERVLESHRTRARVRLKCPKSRIGDLKRYTSSYESRTKLANRSLRVETTGDDPARWWSEQAGADQAVLFVTDWNELDVVLGAAGLGASDVQARRDALYDTLLPQLADKLRGLILDFDATEATTTCSTTPRTDALFHTTNTRRTASLRERARKFCVRVSCVGRGSFSKSARAFLSFTRVASCSLPLPSRSRRT